MRNLKKALSLVLAMVMLLGMMVVGAGAAGFKDEAQISDEYKTAAAVLKEIGVMEGTDGYLNPKAGLSRAEGAAIIYRLITGGLSLNPTGESGFVDVDSVPSFSWASGTVAACRDLGIVSGVDATHFNPGEPLTVAAFSKMLLVTLGYENKYAGYSGEKWEANVARDARTRGILLDGLAMNAQLTREQAAQMSFQALTASMVEYKGMNVTIGDTALNSPATVKLHSTDQGGFANTTYDGKTPTPTTPIRLCEERFPDLKLRDDSDDYGRAIKEWRLKNIAIDGTQTAVAADATFTAISKKADVEKEIGKANNRSNATTKLDVALFINGDVGNASASDFDFDSSNDTTVDAEYVAALTGDGRVVEVYLNETNKQIIDQIVVIETTKATVTQVNTAKENFRISFKTYDDYEGASKNEIIDKDSDFASLVGEVKKDDILAVVANSEGDVLDLYVPEVTEGYVTYVQKDNTLATVDGSSVKAYGDKTRKTADKAFTDTLHQTVKAYMVNGYALAVTGAKVTPKVAGENYIYVTDIWVEAPNRYSENRSVKIEGILADGSTKTLTLYQGASVAAADKWKDGPSTLTGQELLDTFTYSNSSGTAGKTLFWNDAQTNNPVIGANKTGNVGALKDKVAGKVYRYYDGKATEATKGYSILVVPTASEVSSALTAELRSNTATLSMTNDNDNKKYIADDVVMVWIDKDGNTTVSGRKTISGDNQGNYYAVTEGGNAVTVIFVSKSTWISDTAVYVAHIYDGWQEYTDKNGKTKQDGWKVGYYVNGEEDEKIMTTSSKPSAATFYTITENGEAYDIKSEGARYCDVVARPVAGSNKAIEVKGEYYNLSGAKIVDTRLDPETGELLPVKYQISELSDLLAMVKNTTTATKVSLHLTNGSVDTIYIVSDDAGRAEVTTDNDSNATTTKVTVESSGAFEVTSGSNGSGDQLVVTIGGETHNIADAQSKALKCFAGVYNEPGQYDGKHVKFTALDRTGNVVKTETLPVTAGRGSCVFYYEGADLTGMVEWAITCPENDDVIACSDNWSN